MRGALGHWCVAAGNGEALYSSEPGGSQWKALIMKWGACQCGAAKRGALTAAAAEAIPSAAAVSKPQAPSSAACGSASCMHDAADTCTTSGCASGGHPCRCTFWSASSPTFVGSAWHRAVAEGAESPERQ